MNMNEIGNSIEKVLDKKISATCNKGCETVRDVWGESNRTARVIAVQGNKTLRQHSANATKQNMHIIDSKQKLALEVKIE